MFVESKRPFTSRKSFFVFSYIYMFIELRFFYTFVEYKVFNFSIATKYPKCKSISTIPCKPKCSTYISFESFSYRKTNTIF